MNEPPLLRLPPELRNGIYEYALLLDGAYRINIANYLEPALTFVCKKVREESQPIFYASNTFNLFLGRDESPYIFKTLLKWLSTIGPMRGFQVRRMELWLGSDGPGNFGTVTRITGMLDWMEIKASQRVWRVYSGFQSKSAVFKGSDSEDWNGLIDLVTTISRLSAVREREEEQEELMRGWSCP